MLTSLFLNRYENRIYINDYIRNRLRVYEEVYIYIYITFAQYTEKQQAKAAANHQKLYTKPRTHRVQRYYQS